MYSQNGSDSCEQKEPCWLPRPDETYDRVQSKFLFFFSSPIFFLWNFNPSMMINPGHMQIDPHTKILTHSYICMIVLFPTFLCVSASHSFHCWEIVHCMNISQFVYLLLDTWDSSRIWKLWTRLPWIFSAFSWWISISFHYFNRYVMSLLNYCNFHFFNCQEWCAFLPSDDNNNPISWMLTVVIGRLIYPRKNPAK